MFLKFPPYADTGTVQDTECTHFIESDRIITRNGYPEVPPHVEYGLSELGKSMRPIIKSMEIFSNEYKRFAKEIRTE